MTVKASEMRVEMTLRSILVGFRLVSAVWVLVLGVIAVATWDARIDVVVGAVTLIWVWSGVTVWAARARRLSSVNTPNRVSGNPDRRATCQL